MLRQSAVAKPAVTASCGGCGDAARFPFPPLTGAYVCAPRTRKPPHPPHPPHFPLCSAGMILEMSNSSNSMGVADLAEHEAEARELLLDLLRELRGNRRLSSWHRNFLAGVTAQVTACRAVTSKQWVIIHELEAAARDEAETVEDLFHLLQWLKGDQRLSASEEECLSGMVAQLGLDIHPAAINGRKFTHDAADRDGPGGGELALTRAMHRTWLPRSFPVRKRRLSDTSMLQRQPAALLPALSKSALGGQNARGSNLPKEEYV